MHRFGLILVRSSMVYLLMLSKLSEQYLGLIWFEVCIYDHWVGFVLFKEFISNGGWQWFELNFGRFK